MDHPLLSATCLTSSLFVLEVLKLFMSLFLSIKRRAGRTFNAVILDYRLLTGRISELGSIPDKNKTLFSLHNIQTRTLS
jgi:hypothetical protein